MRKFRQLGLSLVLALALLGVLAVPAFAANPTVSITVTAETVSITNTQSTWAIGTVAASSSHKWGASDTYSTIENTGTVNVDVEIQGTDLTCASYNWTLAADGNAGSEIYGLKATTGTEYNVIVKKTECNDITTDLPHTSSNTVTWSMTFYAPTAFNAAEDGTQKSGTVTLVASKSV